MCSSSATAAPGDLRFLPLLFVVLAIAARLAPERLCGDVRNRRLTSQRYYWSCECLWFVVVVPMFTNYNSTSLTTRGGRHTAELLGDDLDTTLGKLEELPANRALTLLVKIERPFSDFRPENNGMLEPVGCRC